MNSVDVPEVHVVQKTVEILQVVQRTVEQVVAEIVEVLHVEYVEKIVQHPVEQVILVPKIKEEIVEQIVLVTQVAVVEEIVQVAQVPERGEDRAACDRAASSRPRSRRS